MEKFKKNIIIVSVSFFAILLYYEVLKNKLFTGAATDSISLFQFIGFILSGFLLLILALIPIFIVYKISKKQSEEKQFLINIFSIAFFIPFSNFVLIVFFKKFPFVFNNFRFADLPFIFGLNWLFVILPLAFIIFLALPKNVFQHKKFALLATCLTAIMGWIFVAITFWFDNSVETYKTLKKLEEYRPTINYIEVYKKQHGIYPLTLDEKSPKTTNYPFFEYKIYNNQKDYRLAVSSSKIIWRNNYYYCSNYTIERCSETFKDKFYNFKKIGHWIKEDSIYND